MPSISERAATWLSDSNVPFLPSSGIKEPVKAEGRDLFVVIDAALSSVVDGIVLGGAVIYSTRAALFADLAHPAGGLGVVYADGTASYNGVYVKSGASSSGSWTITALALPSTFAADLAAKVNATRVVLGAGLVTGGGSLTADRTLTVTAATSAQVRAGTSTDTAITPAALAPIRSEQILTSGDILKRSPVSTLGINANGSATAFGGLGLTIPNGSSGKDAYRAVQFDFSGMNDVVGAKVIFITIVNVSANFDPRTLATGVQIVDADGDYHPAAATAVRNIQLSATQWRLEAEYTILGGEQDARVYAQIAGAPTAFIGAGSLEIAYMNFILDATTLTLTQGRAPDDLLDWREVQILKASNAYVEARLNQTVRSNDYIESVLVGPTRTYTTLTAALAARGGGNGFYSRKAYLIDPGVYTDTNITVPAFVDVIGQGKPFAAWFKGELPDNVAVATIPTVQTFTLNVTARLINLRITCRNMRYPIHSDSGASANRAVIGAKDCWIEHLGNDGARTYQTSIGQDPNGVWGAEHALGIGTHSGEIITIDTCRLHSKRSALYAHNNAGFAEPSRIIMTGGVAICTADDSGFAVVLDAAGSGQQCEVILTGVELRGIVTQRGNRDLALAADDNWAQMVQNFKLTMIDCTPVAVIATNLQAFYDNPILEIRDVFGGGVIGMDGSAAIPLFGKSPELSGRSAYSSIAMGNAPSGVSIGTTLAERLGDCTSINKVLNLHFASGVNKTLTLSANYSGLSNTAVIAALNAAIADGTRVFYANTTHYENVDAIEQGSREGWFTNADTADIVAGMALTFSGSLHALKRMSNQAIGEFAGISKDNVPVGGQGRVTKPGGMVHQSIVPVSAPITVTYGDLFGPDATQPGRFIETTGVGGAVSVLKAVTLRGDGAVFKVLSA